MQDKRDGVDRMTKEDDVKDGLSYTPSCLWRRIEKIREDEVAQKIRYRFCFLFVFF